MLGSKQTAPCSRGILTLSSNTVHYADNIEKMVQNKGGQCLCLQDRQKYERSLLSCFPAWSSPSQLMLTSSFQFLSPKTLKSFLAPFFVSHPASSRNLVSSTFKIYQEFSYFSLFPLHWPKPLSFKRMIAVAYKLASLPLMLPAFTLSPTQ